MKRLALAALLIVLSSFDNSIIARDCKFQIHRNERHTTTAQKKEVYRRAGVPWDLRSCCVVDHVIPLELGGLDETSNMQLQTKVDGKAKDKLENHLARLVCDGTITLAYSR